MNNKLRKGLSLSLFLLGLIIFATAPMNVTGAVIGAPQITSGITSLIGIVLMFAALMVFTTGTLTNPKKDEDLEETIRGYYKRPLKWMEEYNELKGEFEEWYNKYDSNVSSEKIEKTIRGVSSFYFNLKNPTGEKENYKNILDFLELYVPAKDKFDKWMGDNYELIKPKHSKKELFEKAISLKAYNYEDLSEEGLLAKVKDYVLDVSNVSDKNKNEIAKNEIRNSKVQNQNSGNYAGEFPEWKNGRPTKYKGKPFREINVNGETFLAKLDHFHEGSNNPQLELYSMFDGKLMNVGEYLGNGKINTFSEKKRNKRGSY